jgi:molybdenum cofactor synthesis domain-containing protein
VKNVKAAVLTVSDRASGGEYEDRAGPLVARMLAESGANVVSVAVVPDERDQIEAYLHEWAGAGIDVIATTGGTGLGPRDVTPEATRAVIERDVPGLAEAMRAAGMRATPRAALSRQVCGTLGETLIVNLPGSPRAALECLEAIMGVLEHAVEMMSG